MPNGAPIAKLFYRYLTAYPKKLAGKVAFVAIDTDESPELAQARSIES